MRTIILLMVVAACGAADGKPEAADFMTSPVIVAFQQHEAERADAVAALVHAEHAAHEARRLALGAWIAHVDLAPLSVSTEKLAGAEARENDRRAWFNDQLAGIAKIRQQLAGAWPDDAAYNDLVLRIPWGDFVKYRHDQVAALFASIAH